MTDLLTDAQRDELRIESAKAAANLIEHAQRKFGASPDTVATAVEGMMTGATYAVWMRRNDALTMRRLRRMLRALVDRAVETVKGRPQ